MLFSGPAAGDGKGPQALAIDYFNAMKNEGMTSLGRFMHPLALAEFKSMLLPVYQMEANSGQRDLMEITFGKSTTIETLRGLDPEDFMNGFMNLVTAQLTDTRIRFNNLEVLGTIEEGDARHVLTRMTIGAGDLDMTEFEILSFLPYQQSWRLQLNGELMGMAQALQRELGSN